LAQEEKVIVDLIRKITASWLRYHTYYILSFIFFFAVVVSSSYSVFFYADMDPPKSIGLAFKGQSSKELKERATEF
jgi:bacteriorhodopsin